jgi:flagellar motor switch protein FliN/FliY
MATSPPLSPPVAEPVQSPEPAIAAESLAETALVPASTHEDGEELFAASVPVARLPVELDVSVAVREFRVRNLLALEPGQVIETQWGHGDDVPLASGEVQLAWSEFEVVDSQLAVRVTRLT